MQTRRDSLRGGVLGVVLAIACAPAAEAGNHPHDRNGFVLGFGLGAGSQGIEDVDDRETSGVGNFRIGWAVRPDLVLHYEGSAWTKEFDEFDETWTFATGVAALTWFPNAGGGYLRGGIGFGTASVEFELGGFDVSADETGFGILAAAGYQWRLTRKFALGPRGEFTWMDLDDVGSADRFSGALDFDWYW